MKAPKKKEEKERKGRGKTQGEELKEALADNDDSSSTTTETSNPDTESNIKEVFKYSSPVTSISMCSIGWDGAAIVGWSLHDLFLCEYLFTIDWLIDWITQEPVKKKVRIVSVEKEQEEVPPSPTKPKTKKQSTTKKENQVEKSRLIGTQFLTILLLSHPLSVFSVVFNIASNLSKHSD